MASLLYPLRVLLFRVELCIRILVNSSPAEGHGTIIHTSKITVQDKENSVICSVHNSKQSEPCMPRNTRQAPIRLTHHQPWCKLHIACINHRQSLCTLRFLTAGPPKRAFSPMEKNIWF